MTDSRYPALGFVADNHRRAAATVSEHACEARRQARKAAADRLDQPDADD